MNRRTALCDQHDSLLVVIDMQSRLLDAIPEQARRSAIDNTARLIRCAGLLDVPVVVTEQYPAGLGRTDAAVREALPEDAGALEKTCFACTGNDRFTARVAAHARRQLVLAGIETHVCVLQTAMRLIDAGHEVFVAGDATAARAMFNHRNALARMRDAGACVSNTESILFEWLRDARHERFKAVSALLK